MPDNDQARSTTDEAEETDQDGAVSIEAQAARELADTIVALRLQHGFKSRYALAKAAGVSIAYVDKLEDGKSTRPSMRHLQRLAAVLGTTAEQLLSESDAYAAQEAAPVLIQRLVRRVAQDQGKPLPRHTAAAIEEILTLFPSIDPQTQGNIVGIIRGLANQPSAEPAKKERAGDGDGPVSK